MAARADCYLTGSSSRLAALPDSPSCPADAASLQVDWPSTNEQLLLLFRFRLRCGLRAVRLYATGGRRHGTVLPGLRRLSIKRKDPRRQQTKPKENEKVLSFGDDGVVVGTAGCSAGLITVASCSLSVEPAGGCRSALRWQCQRVVRAASSSSLRGFQEKLSCSMLQVFVPLRWPTDRCLRVRGLISFLVCIVAGS